MSVPKTIVALAAIAGGYQLATTTIATAHATNAKGGRECQCRTTTSRSNTSSPSWEGSVEQSFIRPSESPPSPKSSNRSSAKTAPSSSASETETTTAKTSALPSKGCCWWRYYTGRYADDLLKLLSGDEG